MSDFWTGFVVGMSAIALLTIAFLRWQNVALRRVQSAMDEMLALHQDTEEKL